jgi:hypothetical protein
MGIGTVQHVAGFLTISTVLSSGGALQSQQQIGRP